MRRHIRYRLHSFRDIRILFLLTCYLFIFIQYLSTKLFYWEEIPSPTLSRLYPDKPITYNLESYSICSREKFNIEKLISYYHRYSQENICFLIEHLDGGPWWSYVSHEFAEILTYLKNLGIESNIEYHSFSYQLSNLNLTQYILNTCQFHENIYLKNPIPIILLVWDINNFQWYKMSDQLKHILNIRLLVFIDDLHYTKHEHFLNRQYLFEHLTIEIFSTYAYLFHNYYHNISSTKITWLPHAASSLSINSINQSAKNLLFISGANIFEWYPCRSRAFLLCKTRQDLTNCLKHPGYGKTMSNDSSFYYGGQRYFSYMKQYIFGLGTCESVHYAIAKLFELPANGLVLVTTKDLIPILKKLYFDHNEHFLTIQCSSVNQLTEEIIDLQKISNEKINKIRLKGQEIVYKYHMTKHRAELLHVRLLAQGLIALSDQQQQQQERREWEQWGRNC